MDELHSALETFVAASAEAGQQALQAPFREVGQACSGCHERFRIPD